ncbi:MAG: glycosyltransferase family 39 protein [Dehalococcoidia bacterium]|nr:glycosyltransferase family 39 protein [Dehalococcoidia bacterium]
MQLRAVSARPRPRLRAVEAGEAEESGSLSRTAYVTSLTAAFGVGILIRAVVVLSSGFPVNDGGMFYAMVRDIQAAGYRIPAFSSYNQMRIPFFYPPLGFYLAAAINDLTPLGLITIFRVVPLALSILIPFAFFLLARDLLESRLAQVLAVAFFGLLPPSYTWMVMGGGLTRAPGFLLSILTIWALRRMYVAPSPRRVALASVLAALTLLTHVEMAWLAGVIGTVLFIAHGRNRAGVINSLFVLLATIGLSAPWWVVVIRQDGLSPLLAAIGSADSSLARPFVALAIFSASVQPLFDVTGALALVGLIACMRKRAYLLPAWLLAIVLLDQRTFLTGIAIAVALLAAIGLTDVLLPFVRTSVPWGEDVPDQALAAAPSPARWLPAVVIGLALLYPFLGAINSTKALRGMSPAEESAMAWVASNTPVSSRFVVVSDLAWPVNRDAEWFPVIAGRRNVGTVQGSEWLPDRSFGQRRVDDVALRACAQSDGACLTDWARSTGNSFEYAYIATGSGNLDGGATCCANLVSSLKSSGDYRLVYDGSGAVIFQRLR